MSFFPRELPLILFLLATAVCRGDDAPLGGVRENDKLPQGQVAAEEGSSGDKPSHLSDKAPVVFRSGAGRFEVIAADGKAAKDALGLADSVWSTLSFALSLPPEGFASEIPLRCVPAEQWRDKLPFAVGRDLGGRVWVSLRWSEGMDFQRARRALVRALLLRQAAVWRADGNLSSVPWWLEEACLRYSLTRASPALLDAMRGDSRAYGPPSLARIFSCGEADATDADRLGAFWLMGALMGEQDGAGRFRALLQLSLGGGNSPAALDKVYGSLWDSAESRELWWQTVFYAQVEAGFPAMFSQEESRIFLRDVCRWVAIEEGRETIVELEKLPDLAREKWVKLELGRRAGLLRGRTGFMHPFYMNAAVSLARFYEESARGKRHEALRLREVFLEDLLTGHRLEQDCAKALDDLEKKMERAEGL